MAANMSTKQAALAPRDRTILLLIAAGNNNLEIARTLGYGQQSIANHISYVVRKFGVKNRIQLAIYALKTGLINLDEIEL